jgi:hypothetical protein
MKKRVLKCNMCGKTAKALVKRWFQYDSGQTFFEWVCEPCSDLHATLVIKAGA